MSHSVAKVVKFPYSTLENFVQVQNEQDPPQEFETLGGVLSNIRYSWLAKGPCIEVRNNKTGCKVCAWTFGYILKDSTTKIVCVEEIKSSKGKSILLAIGLECAISGGVICIFDVFGSKVIRTIQIKDKITSLHVVDSGSDDLNLRGPLRNFDGILAIGTEHGNVLLIDICKTICEEALHNLSPIVRDELYPCQLMMLRPKDIGKIEHYKEVALRDGDHVAIHLNVVTDSKTEHFTLKGQKGEDRLHVNKEEVTVSAIYYCPQLTSLLVGYNFGAYQMWNLCNFDLVYTSPVCEEHMPITQFAMQEPADDPRAFCYIWVVYSPKDQFQCETPFAVMYSFSYDTKDYQEGYGHLYQDFQYCAVRFQVELDKVPGWRPEFGKVIGGKCTGLQVIHKSPSNKLSSEDNFALCLIYWLVWNANKDLEVNMILFDLNQWYKDQMPNTPKENHSSYMVKTNLTSKLDLTIHNVGDIISARLDEKTIRQFIGTQRLEEHFCPNSLTFDIWCLREHDVAKIATVGLQRALLVQIETDGPLSLVRPSEIFQQILNLGLSPLFVDIPMNIPVSTDIQREVFLDVVLEQQLIGWLCRCASEWANGSFSSAGCSLDFLVTWAFQRAILVKSNCDKYCKTLFDYSQIRLDNNTCMLLKHCTRQIGHLCTFYSFVLDKLSGYLRNNEVISEQFKLLKNISDYFEVLQWLMNVGLLPECPPSSYPRPDENERISAPYPVQQLTEYYNEKRSKLQQITENSFASKDSLLFIDSLITHTCGAEELQSYWREDGGNGLYPPPSLQSLLRTYLIEGPDINHKHSLVIYVFLDLAMSLEPARYNGVITNLIKFPAVFKVSPSIIKITQAFWQLDHGDYTVAIEQLLDSFVLDKDLKSWHHAVALRALLLQNQNHYALLYMQVRKPPVTDEKDVLTAISLFITNNMIDKAFYFQKLHQNNNEEALLLHLFKECYRNDSLKSLLYRNLEKSEEKTFFKYLQTIRNPSSDDLQVFYHLLRSRFVEAFDTHRNSKRLKPECQGLVGQRNASKTDNIVKLFKNLLPDVNRNLVDIVRRERTNLWKGVPESTPLSVFVNDPNERIHYNSTILHAAVSKAKQTFDNFDGCDKNVDITSEETPFLRRPTDVTTSLKRKIPIITCTEIRPVFDRPSSPPPEKRRKLSPTISAVSLSPTNISSIAHTPVVKRKISDAQRLDDSYNPQSILKSRNTNNETEDDIARNCDFSVSRLDQSPKKSALGLTPRKSLNRASVRFTDSSKLLSFEDTTTKVYKDNTSMRLDNSMEETSVRRSNSSKDSSGNDVYYSPDNSFNNSTSKDSILNRSKSAENTEIGQEIAEDVKKDKDPEENCTIEDEEEEESDVHIKTHLEVPFASSPRARRSYKRSFGENISMRSSPKFSSSIQTKEQNKSLLEESIVIKSSPRLSTSTQVDEQNITGNKSDLELSDSSLKTPRTKIKARKPLSRQVLELNASKLLQSSIDKFTPIKKESSFIRTEKKTVKTTKLNSTETSISEIEVQNFETKIYDPLMSISRERHYESSNIKQKSMLNETTDDSFDSNVSVDLRCPYDGPVISDSIMEYLDEVSKRVAERERLKEENEKNKEKEKTPEVNEESNHSEENLQPWAENNKEETNHSEKNVEPWPTNNEESAPSEENVPSWAEQQLEQSRQENVAQHYEEEPMEVELSVYDDLSSGNEDLQEVIANENVPSRDENEAILVYADLMNPAPDMNQYQENDKCPSDNNDGMDIEKELVSEKSNILEKNIILEDSQVTLGRYSNEYDSDENDLDKGFRNDSLKPEPVIDSQVIEIGSSSEDEKKDDQNCSTSESETSSTESNSDSSEKSSKSSRSSSKKSSGRSSSSSRRSNSDIELKVSYAKQNSGENEIEDGELNGNIIHDGEEENTDPLADPLKEDSQTGNAVVNISDSDEVGPQENEVDQETENQTTEKNDSNVENPENNQLTKENIESSVIPVDETEIVSENPPELNENILHGKEENSEMEVSEDGPKEDEANAENLRKVNEVDQLNEELNDALADIVQDIKSIEEDVNKQEEEKYNEEEISNDQMKDNVKEAIDAETRKEDSKSKEQAQEKEKKNEEAISKDEMKDEVEETKAIDKETKKEDSKSKEHTQEVGKNKEQTVSKDEMKKEVEETKETKAVDKETIKEDSKSKEQAEVDKNKEDKSKDVKTKEVEPKVEENIPARRVTRRSSLLSSSEEVTDDVLTPTRRSGRSKSITSNSSRVSTRRSSQVSEDNEREMGKSSETKKDKLITSKESSSSNRLGQKSVDEASASRPKKRSSRSASVTEDPEEKPRAVRSTRSSSVSELPAIVEEKKNSAMESYVASRRLTRRQSLKLKEIDSGIEKIDPINLLDKESFQGSADMDEAFVYETSPSTSNNSSLRPTRRLSRSASGASDTSVSTPVKKGRKSLSNTRMDSPAVMGIKTRLRRQSTDAGSVTSDKSEPPSPPKRTKKQESEETSSEVGSVRSTRSRNNSISSIKSDSDIADSPRRSTRARKIVACKSDLPEITEERSSEASGASEASAPKKRSRKPSTQK